MYDFDVGIDMSFLLFSPCAHTDMALMDSLVDRKISICSASRHFSLSCELDTNHTRRECAIHDGSHRTKERRQVARRLQVYQYYHTRPRILFVTTQLSLHERIKTRCVMSCLQSSSSEGHKRFHAWYPWYNQQID